MACVRGSHIFCKGMGHKIQGRKILSRLSPLNSSNVIFLRQMSVLGTVKDKYLAFTNEVFVTISELPPTLYIQGN